MPITCSSPNAAMSESNIGATIFGVTSVNITAIGVTRACSLDTRTFGKIETLIGHSGAPHCVGLVSGILWNEMISDERG